MITVWVDADSCPKMVRDYLVNYTNKLKLPLNFVANRTIPQNLFHFKFQMIVCEKESGAADDYIVENSSKSDLVVTRDIPLADRLVKLEISVMNDRGFIFTKDNIAERLSERNLNLQFAELGLGGVKQNTYSKKEFSQFANCFDKEIHRILRENNQL